MREKNIEEWLTKQVEGMGGMALKFVSPGSPGVPDRICIFPGGKIYFVELKKESGRMSDIQKWQRARFEGMGCRFYVVHGMKEAKEFVRGLEDEIHTS